MAQLVVETQNLSYRSGGRYLLHDINWQVEQGQHWVVFGMNGCGKTTLLSIISGFRQPTQGKLQVLGEAYSQKNILRQRSKIGFVSTSFFERYYKKESALHIVLSGKFGTLGLNSDIKDEDVVLAISLLKELHLSDKINYPFDCMSRGERQNVLIARALFANPNILLLDEPTTGLDVYNREHFLNTVDRLASLKNMTIIYVTHYTEEILPVFQHCLLLKNGHTFAKGKIDDLLDSNLLTKFLNYPVSCSREKGKIYTHMDVVSNVNKILGRE